MIVKGNAVTIIMVHMGSSNNKSAKIKANVPDVSIGITIIGMGHGYIEVISQKSRKELIFIKSLYFC